MTLKRQTYTIGWFNGAAVFILGRCDRSDEGRVGHDVKYRPARMGYGPYTAVTSPDAIEGRVSYEDYAP